MLNEERYRSIRRIFERMELQLSERDMELYADAFEIISQFLHHKLNDIQLVKVVDYLGDVITEKATHIVSHVPKSDRLKVQYVLLEKIPPTKGKLNQEEKELLAFCVYWMNCVQVYDEEQDTIVTGLRDFTSVDKIRALYEDEKTRRPDFFALWKPKPTVDETTYGLSLDNPIRVKSIPVAYEYLNRLRYNGQPVHYERIGSFEGGNKGLVDGYTLTTTQRGFLKKKTVNTVIYIDPYSDWNILLPPPGFEIE